MLAIQSNTRLFVAVHRTCKMAHHNPGRLQAYRTIRLYMGHTGLSVKTSRGFVCDGVTRNVSSVGRECVHSDSHICWRTCELAGTLHRIYVWSDDMQAVSNANS